MRSLYVVLFLIISSSVIGQHRVAIYDVQRDRGTTAQIADVSSYLVGFYASDDRFIVIDKANSQIIKDEQDRQKSEEFIDGYIVDQGKQEGFDYCLYPKYSSTEKLLTVKVYDVAKGIVLTNQSKEMKQSLFGTTKDLKSAVIELADKINTACFEYRLEIVRCIDKKKKASAKQLLFAVGYNQSVKEGDDYEVYVLVNETVGGKAYERKEVIGYGEIEEIQDGNFSTLKVNKGGEAIMTNLNNGNKLYGSKGSK